MIESVPHPENVVPPTLASKLFDAFVSAGSFFFLAVPAALLIFSFKKSSTFNKDDGSYHTKLRDDLDAETFRDTVIPLYASIDSDLTEEILKSDLSNHTGLTSEQFFLKMSEEKYALIQKKDYSYASQKAIELQEQIEGFIKTKRNQITLKGCIKWCRRCLILSTVLNALTIVAGIILICAHEVFVSERVASFALFGWVVLISLAIAALIAYWLFSVKIDGFSKKI